MNRLFGMLRYSKQLLIVFIVSIIDISFILGVAIFDIVQLVQVKNNSVSLSPSFIPMNIALIVVVGLSLILVCSMFVIKLIKGKKNES